MSQRSGFSLGFAAIFLTLVPAASPVAAGERHHPPTLQTLVVFEPRSTPASTRTISDVDLLSDGRIAVADFDTRRVAIFSSKGRFEKFLDPPGGISPEETLIPRLVALPEGGLVLADAQGYRLFFYDSRLSPKNVVPFGLEIISLNGFVRHPSGDFYIVGFGIQNGKILHRFDSSGAYIDSHVDAPDLSVYEPAYCSGLIAVDPADGTLWLSRLTPYEILHLSPSGEVLSTITREPLGGFRPPRAEKVGHGLIRLRGDFSSSSKIAVIGNLVVNSYVTEQGKKFADLFERDGTLVQSGLRTDSPYAFNQWVGGDVFVRFSNRPSPRIEVWGRKP